MIDMDHQLEALFAASPPPPRFTADVLRRVQEERWRRKQRLDRVYYGGLCASVALAIAGVWLAFGVLADAVPAAARITALPGDLAMNVATAGMMATLAATWRRLRRS